MELSSISIDLSMCKTSYCMTVMLINWGSFDIPPEVWSPFASPLFGVIVGRFFFFGRSINVHTFPWEEQSAQGGAVSILHATFGQGGSGLALWFLPQYGAKGRALTWRFRQKSQGRYFRDLYNLGPG